MKSSPCRDCKTRHMNCHSSCEEYMKWRKEMDEDHKAVVEGKKLISLDFVSGTKGTMYRR